MFLLWLMVISGDNQPEVVLSTRQAVASKEKYKNILVAESQDKQP